MLLWLEVNSKMAKRYSRSFLIFTAILSLIIGFVFGAFSMIYVSIPESYVIPETVATQKTVQHISNQTTVSSNLDVDVIKNQDLSIHFLELGNKYTGDCTLIKVGNQEVLIDAGSRASSVPVIKEYLDQYVTDGIIEYVIVTHAHQDHIAGFGTSANTDSLFDLYNVGTVIQFVYTSSTAQVYQNYCRELADLQARCGTEVYNALQCIEETDGARNVYQLNADIELEILDQKYYHSNSAKNENNNSVCCQIVQNHEKYYLFTGDLESDGEASLVTMNELHQVELYKAGYHGSKTSSSNALLSVIKPKCVCVCCCAGSSEYTPKTANQFPTQDFINRVAPYTQQVYVTTLCVDYAGNSFTSMNGCIVLYCRRDDENLTVACSNNTTILKDTDWFTANRTLPKNWSV